MEFRRLGDSGLTVSVVGLGTNNFGRRLQLDQSRTVIQAALDAGITLFDTADVYSDSELHLGEALQGHRDDVILATKFGISLSQLGQRNGIDWDARGSRRYIRRAVESSLQRLRTDWIDLYQIHRPDPHTPIEETLSVLTDLVREGKIRYVGHSGFTGWETADAEWTARTRGFERFISAQNEYNLINRGVEAELVPALEHYRIGLLPYSPLANGLLTGKYHRGQAAPAGSRLASRESVLDSADFDRIEAIEKFATERGASLLDVAISGLAAMPAVSSVIAGATTVEQITANVAAGQWKPSAEDLAELRRITAPDAMAAG